MIYENILDLTFLQIAKFNFKKHTIHCFIIFQFFHNHPGSYFSDFPHCGMSIKCRSFQLQLRNKK